MTTTPSAIADAFDAMHAEAFERAQGFAPFVSVPSGLLQLAAAALRAAPAAAAAADAGALGSRPDYITLQYLDGWLAAHPSAYIACDDGHRVVINVNLRAIISEACAFRATAAAAIRATPAPADVAALLTRVAALVSERDGWREEYERVRADRDGYEANQADWSNIVSGYQHDADVSREVTERMLPHVCTCGVRDPDVSKHADDCRYALIVMDVTGRVPDDILCADSDDEEGPDSEY